MNTRKNRSDHILTGCAMAFGCQILFLALGIFTGLGNRVELVLSSWGLTQWIGILPLIVWQRAVGRRRTVQGLIIMGCIGLLLASACAAAFWNGKIGG